MSVLLTKAGLLARGLAAIGPRGGLEGWRWIFIIEGLLVGNTIALDDQPSSILTSLDRPLRVDRRCLPS